MKGKRPIHRSEELVTLFNPDSESRAFEEYELREDGTEDRDKPAKKVIEGYAVVFNSPTEIHDYYGRYTETIEETALRSTDMTDVALFFNHDMWAHVPLARSKKGKGTLSLTVDKKGLKIRTELDTEGNPQAKEIYSAIQRGDVTGMSFTFRVKSGGDSWTGLRTDNPARTIKDISIIHEVSVVNYPAYKATSINARSEDGGNQFSPLAEARKAMDELELEKEKAKTFLI